PDGGDQDHPLTTDIEEKLSRGPSRVKAGHRFCPPETVRRQDPQRAECPPGNLETKCAPCRSSLLDYTQGSSDRCRWRRPRWLSPGVVVVFAKGQKFGWLSLDQVRRLAHRREEDAEPSPPHERSPPDASGHRRDPKGHEERNRKGQPHPIQFRLGR